MLERQRLPAQAGFSREKNNRQPDKLRLLADQRSQLYATALRHMDVAGEQIGLKIDQWRHDLARVGDDHGLHAGGLQHAGIQIGQGLVIVHQQHAVRPGRFARGQAVHQRGQRRNIHRRGKVPGSTGLHRPQAGLKVRAARREDQRHLSPASRPGMCQGAHGVQLRGRQANVGHNRHWRLRQGFKLC